MTNFCVGGFDPRDILMNGSMNVVTGFAFGTLYDTTDPEFLQLKHSVKKFFEHMMSDYIFYFLTTLSPAVLNRQYWYRYFLSDRALKRIEFYVRLTSGISIFAVIYR